MEAGTDCHDSLTWVESRACIVSFALQVVKVIDTVSYIILFSLFVGKSA